MIAMYCIEHTWIDLRTQRVLLIRYSNFKSFWVLTNGRVPEVEKIVKYIFPWLYVIIPVLVT